MLRHFGLQLIDKTGKERVVREIHPESLGCLHDSLHDFCGKDKFVLAHFRGFDIRRGNNLFRHWRYSLPPSCTYSYSASRNRSFPFARHSSHVSSFPAAAMETAALSA